MKQKEIHKRIWGTLLFIITGAIIAATVTLHSPPSGAKTAVSWTPAKISQAIDAGDSKKVTASFTASTDLTDVVVNVVPEIAPYVATEPIAFGDVAKGETRDLEITIYAPVDVDSVTVEGTIQLKRGSGSKKTYAQPLPVTINLTGLPPDPGEAGKATLEGIDSDGDGVRDDVQRYIALTYSDSEKMRAGLTQFSTIQQKFLLNADNKEAVIKNAQLRQKSIECVFYISREGAGDIIRALRAEILNTEGRTKVYISADAKLGGEVFKISQQFKSSCEFDPDELEN